MENNVLTMINDDVESLLELVQFMEEPIYKLGSRHGFMCGFVTATAGLLVGGALTMYVTSKTKKTETGH